MNYFLQLTLVIIVMKISNKFIFRNCKLFIKNNNKILNNYMLNKIYLVNIKKRY